MHPDRLPQFLRISGFICGAIFATAASLSLLLWANFDGRKLRQDLMDSARVELGRDLRIDGDLSLSVWPRLALKTGRMSLSEPGREEVFAAVQSARIGLSRWQLLLGQYIVTDTDLGGLDLRLQRSRDGKWNFADLLDAPAKKEGAPVQLQWALNSFSTNAARLLVRDFQTGQRLEFGDLQLRSGALQTVSQGGFTATARVIEQASNTEAELFASAGYALDTNSGSLIFNTLQLKLDGQIAAQNDSKLSLNVDSLHWQMNTASGKLNRAQLQFTTSEGTRKFDLDAQVPALGWTALGPSIDNADARLRIRGDKDEDAEYKLALTKLEPKAGGLSAELVAINWRHVIGIQGAQGKISGPADLDWKSSTISLLNLQGEALALHPNLNPANARAELSASVRWTYADVAANQSMLDTQIDAGLGTDQLLLNAQLRSLSPLVGRFKLSSPQLDMDRLLDRSKKAPSASGWLALPAGAVLDGQVSLGNVRLGGMLIDSFSSPLRLGQGILNLSPHKVDLYSGSIAGGLTINPENLAQWRGSFSKIELAPLLTDSKLKAPLDGELSAQGDLSAQLDNLLLEAPALNGTLRFSLTNGSWRGQDMAQSLREFLPAIDEKRDAARSPKQGERTILSRASGTVVLKNGIGKLQNFSASNPWLQLTGTGDVGVSQDFIDLRLRAQIGSPGPKSSAADLTKLRGKIVPLRFKGPLEQPDVHMNLAPAAKAAP